MTSPTPPAPAAGTPSAEPGSEFRKDMGPWANFALGFTYLSPVVSTYTLFGIAIVDGGPPMIWAFLLAGCGQFLVALIFGEIVAPYPSRAASTRGPGGCGASAGRG